MALWLCQSKRLEIGFDLGSPRFQEWWEGQSGPEAGRLFIDGESRAISGKLEEDIARLTKIDAPEIVSIYRAAIRNVKIPQMSLPCMIGLLIRHSERNMVNSARSRSMPR